MQLPQLKSCAKNRTLENLPSLRRLSFNAAAQLIKLSARSTHAVDYT